MNKQHLIIVVVGLSLGLAGSPSAALAQETQEDITATDGDAAALGTGNASSAPGTVTRGGGSGTSLLGPDGTYHVSELAPPTVNAPASTEVEIVPAPTDSVPTAPTEAVAADSDGDSVIDDDEIGVYGTDPTVWDTDSDGLSDGDELFVAGTDPCVWDTDGDGVSDGGIAAEVAPETVTETETAATDEGAPVVTDEGAAGSAGLDSDADRLADADEAAVGTDPTSPDSDGDGYYDGDEVILGTDPHDPVSFPAA
jgi:cell division septation protein DedD